VAISRKHKKTVKGAFQGSDSPKPKRVWAIKVGDLVEVDDKYGVVTRSDEGGSYYILGPEFRGWIHAKKVRKIQRAEDDCDK
jgi:hypothetical protein